MQYALREFFRHPEDVKIAKLDGKLKDKRIVVQGLGNVGYHAAKFLSQEDGSRIIGIIERDGALYDANGLDVEAVHQWIAGHGGVKGFADAQYVENGAELLEIECDILIPAALEGVINLTNAERVKAPLIIELQTARSPRAPTRFCATRGRLSSDLYANAGGVTVSYFEWVKNLSHIRFGRMQRRQEEARHQLVVDELERLDRYLGDAWSMSPEFKEKYLRGADELELVRSGLDDTMRVAYQSMREVWHARDDVDDLRMAAFIVAIERIAASYRAKGL